MTEEEYFKEEDWEHFSERKPIQKEDGNKGFIDESPSWLELSEALATKEYRLLRLERLEPATADIFLIKVQDTKPIDRKLDTSKIPDCLA